MRIRVLASCVLVASALACGDDNPVGPTESRRRYLLSVTVTEPVGLGVWGYRLTVVDREQTRVIHDAASDYRLVAVEGPVTIEVAKEGYHTKSVSFELRGSAAQDVEIQPVTPPAAFSGPFWMTLSADPTCGVLPSALRTRRYAVDADQAGAALVVHMSDPKLTGKNANGQVHGTTLQVDFGHPDSFYEYYQYYIIEEPLDDTRTLGVGGSMEASVSGDGATGRLTGTWEVVGPEGSPRCEGGVHAVRFERR